MKDRIDNILSRCNDYVNEGRTTLRGEHGEIYVAALLTLADMISQLNTRVGSIDNALSDIKIELDKIGEAVDRPRE